MNDAHKERTLVEERLHWGIFFLPVRVAIALILCITLPPMLYWIFLKRMILAVAGAQLKFSFFSTVLPIAIVPGVFAGLLLSVSVFSAYRNSQVKVTDRRILFRTGVLRRLTGEFQLENVEAVFLVEPILGRMFGYCTVIVTGLGSNRVLLPYLPSARDFYAALQKAILTAKSKRDDDNPPSPLARGPMAAG